MLDRRRAILTLAIGVWALCVPSGVLGSVARAATTRDLVVNSRLVVVGTPLEADSRWEDVGGQRRIVTYTRVSVDRQVQGADEGSEVLVRTLGGQVGKIGQIVVGEAMLVVGTPSFLFLAPDHDGVLGVTAMAQGQFPLQADDHGALRLAPATHLPELVGQVKSAQKELVGRTTDEASVIVSEAKRSAH